ncbi:MAG: hypothetical protein HXY20_14440 [Acidobacteria bacterium]|nr:hypothetical protein [Acidobacteriota bacterium]
MTMHKRRKPGKAGKKRSWTDEEIAELKRLYRTCSNARIAKLLRRSPAAVLFKANRLGLFKGIRRLRKMGRENVRRRWQGR